MNEPREAMQAALEALVWEAGSEPALYSSQTLRAVEALRAALDALAEKQELGTGVLFDAPMPPEMAAWMTEHIVSIGAPPAAEKQESGLCWTNPAPHAAAPLMPTGKQYTVQIGVVGAAPPAREPLTEEQVTKLVARTVNSIGAGHD